MKLVHVQEEETLPQVLTFNVADPDLACIQKILLAHIYEATQTGCSKKRPDKVLHGQAPEEAH